MTRQMNDGRPVRLTGDALKDALCASEAALSSSIDRDPVAFATEYARSILLAVDTYAEILDVCRAMANEPGAPVMEAQRELELMWACFLQMCASGEGLARVHRLAQTDDLTRAAVQLEAAIQISRAEIATL